MTTVLQLWRDFFSAGWRFATGRAPSARPTHIDSLHSRLYPRTRPLLASVVALCLTANIASVLSTYPHTLSYFNEIAGGPLNGPSHLLSANVDWGQDSLFLNDWCRAHPQAQPLHGEALGGILSETQAPHGDLRLSQANSGQSLDYPVRCAVPSAAAAWSAHRLDYLYGRDQSIETRRLQNTAPAARVGYSIRIYRFTPSP